MTSSRRPAVKLAAILCAALLLTAGRLPDREVRAIWVLRTALRTPDGVATMVRAAREAGFTTLLVQVRGRGDALFRGGSEPRSPLLAAAPGDFDPLATTLDLAHAAGLEVHAWINVNLVASAVDVPADRGHVVTRHPEWLMVPRALAEELARVDPGSPAYAGRLARWTRLEPTIEGLYLSPIPPAAAAYTAAVVEQLVRRYPVDGVHLDYIRYPRGDFDYSRLAVEEFRASLVGRLPAAELARLDARQKVDLFAYPDAFPAEWHAFRRSRLSALVMRLRSVVKRHRPGALVSAAVVPDPGEAREQRLQDWPLWVEGGMVDVVCPMAYTPDPALFAQQIAAARDAVGAARLWAGIGAYRLSVPRMVERIFEARRLGVAGIALFSYDSVTEPAQLTPDYLVQVGRGAFGGSAQPELR